MLSNFGTVICLDLLDNRSDIGKVLLLLLYVPVNLKMTLALLLLSPMGCMSAATASSSFDSSSVSGRGQRSKNFNRRGMA